MDINVSALRAFDSDAPLENGQWISIANEFEEFSSLALTLARHKHAFSEDTEQGLHKVWGVFKERKPGNIYLCPPTNLPIFSIARAHTLDEWVA